MLKACYTFDKIQTPLKFVADIVDFPLVFIFYLFPIIGPLNINWIWASTINPASLSPSAVRCGHVTVTEYGMKPITLQILQSLSEGGRSFFCCCFFLLGWNTDMMVGGRGAKLTATTWQKDSGSCSSCSRHTRPGMPILQREIRFFLLILCYLGFPITHTQT